MSPKFSAKELAALREEVFDRYNYKCLWPGCIHDLNNINPLQLAHLQHRGMGGSRSANTLENTVPLCRIHHDCLDGRTGLGTLRQELNTMLRAQQ